MNFKVLETHAHHQAESPLDFNLIISSAGVKVDYATNIVQNQPVVRHRVWFTRGQVQQI